MERLKELVVRLLNRAVIRYIRRNNITVIAVAGSIGKTSTANAIRTVLSQKYQVHVPKTAYNTNKSVHLELFDLPFATSVTGWIGMVGQVLFRSLGKAHYEVAVIEIGTDHPGELRSFAWLQPKIGVLTAIAPEHMEYFQEIEAVAREELTIADFSKQLIFNANMVSRDYVDLELAERAVWYGRATSIEAQHYRVKGATVYADFHAGDDLLEDVALQVLGVHSLDGLLAAVAVGRQCGMDTGQIRRGLQAVEPVKGRMQRLAGSDGVLIIDDSYNASPEAIKAALDVLVQFEAPQHIAVLGAMNEMGDYSAHAHREVGVYCDPAKLDLVVTIGKDANTYIAGAAEAGGCRVARFDSPYDAGAYVRQQVKADAVVLFKGSQNGVFAEEAIKPLLARKADESKLVRQSPYWKRQKTSQFEPRPNTSV